MQARSRRTEVSSDRVVEEFAKIAFANTQDYWPKEGKRLDLNRLNQDRAAAVEEITIDEATNSSGALHRRTHLKLRDKQPALDSLGRHLGMFADRHIAERSIEQGVSRMTPQERQALAEELLEHAAKYVPLYEQDQREQAPAQTEGRADKVGDVFTPDVISTHLAYKRAREVDEMRLRPHPYEFFLYYDV